MNHHTRVNAHMSLSCRNWLQGQGSLAEARSQPRSTRPVPPMPLSHRREQGWGYSSLGRAIGSRTIGCGVTSMAAGPASRSHANRSAKGLSSGIARSRGCSGHGKAETSGLVAGGAKLTLRSRSRYCFASRLPVTVGSDPRLPWRSSPFDKAISRHANDLTPATGPCSEFHLLINSPRGAALTRSRGRWPASRPAGDRGSESASAAGKVGPGGVGRAAARHPPAAPPGP